MGSGVTPGPGEVLKFSDLVPGLLSLSWRIPSIVKTMREILGFRNDSPLSIGTILEQNAETHPENTALLYEDVRLTHGEFNSRINQYAHYLSSQGVNRGDVALVLVDNRPELLMVIGALSKLGGVASLINPNQRGEVLLHSINLTRGRTFIVGEELLEAFEEIKGELELIRNIKLGTHTLANFKTTRNGSVLVVTFEVNAPGETLAGKTAGEGTYQRMAIWIETESGWQLIAYANLAPLKK